MDPQGAHDKQTEQISVVGYGTKTEVFEAAKCPRCSASVPLETIRFASNGEEGEQSAPKLRPPF
jgi:hypothetical protein